MREIIEVIPRENYRLEIAFDDGERAIVDVKPLMKRRVFQPLKDKSFFRQVEIDHKFGGVQWPNGADVCIDWIEAESKVLTTRRLTEVELSAQIAEKKNVDKKVVEEFFKSLIEEIRQNLKENTEIRLGRTFSVVKKAAKNKIPATKAQRFTAPKSLKKAVKKSK
jgi:nucleoid DNA-binding protein